MAAQLVTAVPPAPSVRHVPRPTGELRVAADLPAPAVTVAATLAGANPWTVRTEALALLRELTAG